jgi:RNA polymerase sigma-70 factor (ECF subfamily)
MSEELLWTVYNIIREIEYSFRTLKTDLNLRPIYHKRDDATMAHLHPGLLAYRVVNTVRYQLKRKLNEADAQPESADIKIDITPVNFQWSVENSLDWVLDVGFSEDHSRKRAGFAAQNYSLLNRIALNLLKNEKTTKRGKRLKAGWDNQYLINLIKIRCVGPATDLHAQRLSRVLNVDLLINRTGYVPGAGKTVVTKGLINRSYDFDGNRWTDNEIGEEITVFLILMQPYTQTLHHIRESVTYMDEQEIINACIRGESWARKKVYEMYAPTMMSLCIRYVGDRETARDLLQDGFVKVFTKIGTYSNKGAFAGWMHRVFVTTALEYLRKTDALRSAVDIADYNEQLKDVDVSVLDQLSADDLMNCVNKLPPGYRTVFNMYAIEGFSHNEIAEELSISVATSKTQFLRARNALRKSVKLLIGNQYVKQRKAK